MSRATRCGFLELKAVVQQGKKLEKCRDKQTMKVQMYILRSVALRETAIAHMTTSCMCWEH